MRIHVLLRLSSLRAATTALSRGLRIIALTQKRDSRGERGYRGRGISASDDDDYTAGRYKGLGMGGGRAIYFLDGEERGRKGFKGERGREKASLNVGSELSAVFGYFNVREDGREQRERESKRVCVSGCGRGIKGADSN